MRAAVDSSRGSFSRSGSQVDRHVSFRHSSSSEAPSEALPTFIPTRGRTDATLQKKKDKTRRSGESSATASASASRTTTARHLAAAAVANDPRQWILALGQPTTAAAASSGESSTPSPAVDGDADRGNAGGSSGPTEDVRTDGRSAEQHDALSGAAVTPLEERIGLQELQLIMLAFRDAPYAELAAEAAAAAAAAAAVAAAATPDASQGQKPAPSAPMQKVPYFVSGDERALMGETMRFAEETLCATGGAVKGTEQRRSAPSSRPASGAAGGALNVQALLQAASSGALATAPLRTLSRGEFTTVLQHAVPSATPQEIHALLAKAISDAQDSVSWNELATFLVTCSRQKSDLAMEDQRFVLAGRPCNLHFEEQHSESITCVAVSRQRRLIVTGCSGGAVRAWSSGSDLAYRGLLLKVEGWIVGLHWGCRERVLYAVTMDRSVYVLEGTTYEVLRVFHGRGIKSTADSVAYATETVGTVNVGGVALPKHRPPNERGYAGARLRMPSASSSKDGKTRSGGRKSCGRRAKTESGEDRMNRLLVSAMQVRRGVSPTPGEDVREAAASPEGSEAASAVVPAAAATSASATAATLTTSYSLTTGGAAEALHQDNTPLTGAGRGPYVVQHVEEGVLAALVDAVSATACEESAFQEDVLLLGTSKGDAFLFVLAHQCDLTQRRVLLARHIFVRLHSGLITKLAFSHAMNALISAGEDGRVRVTSLVSGQSVRTFYAPELPEQHTSVTDFALHPQLKMLLTIGPERRALVWEWNQPSPIAVLEAVNRPLCCGAFVGEQLLTVSRDRVMHVYDSKSFRLRQEVPLGLAGSLTRFGGANAAASAFASSSSSAAASASSWTLSQLHVDQARQRVLGFGRFPFALCVKRQVSSGCPVRYRGHHAPMLATLTSRAFGQVVTVGTDGVIMTWTPATGVNEFSFLLSNFSNAAATTGAPMSPIAASMDVLQRRLLTGFAGGIVVAWNVLNGQVERVLTAATAGRNSVASSPAATYSNAPNSGGSGAAPASAVSAAASTAAPKRGVTAVGSFLRYRCVSYLFAVGRTLYVDADPTSTGGGGGGGAAAGPQLGEYTTTYPSAWTPQPVYGDVTQLLQISPQNVGCGTTSGAVLIYNVLSDSQEGAPLWVSESMLFPQHAVSAGGLAGLSPAAAWRSGNAAAASSGMGATRGRSVTSRHGVAEDGPLRLATNGFSSDSTRLLSPLQHGGSTAAADDTSAFNLVQRGHVMARTIRLLTLPSIHPRLLVVAQEDGTLSLWHTLRRVCIGAVNLTAVGGIGEEQSSEADRGRSSGGNTGGADAPARDDGPAGTFLFDMEDEEGRLLVFGDGEGNVHVCRLEWQELATSAEQVAAMSLPNPLLYTLTSATVASPETLKSQKKAENGNEEEKEEAAPSTPTGSCIPDFNEAQRSIPLLRKLERVHVFSSGLVLAGLRIVDTAAASSLIPTVAAATAPPAAVITKGGEACARPPRDFPRVAVPPAEAAASTAAAPTAQSRRPLVIVCTGADHYVRVFTLSGVPIGELGMDEWDVTDPRTFRFMGESMGVPAVPLPCSVAGHHTWQRDPAAVVEASPCYFNYLSDLHTVHFSRGGLTSGGSRGSARYGRISIAPAAVAAAAAQRRSAAAAAAAEKSTYGFALDGMDGQASPSATQRGAASPVRERRGQSVSPERRPTAAAAAQSMQQQQHGSSGNADVLSLVPDNEGAPIGEAGGAMNGMMPSAAAEEWAAATTTADWTSWQVSPPTPPTARSLSTRLHRSTRYRHTTASATTRPRSPGVVRRSCIAALLPRAATPLTRRRLSTAGGGAAASAAVQGCVSNATHTPSSPNADPEPTWAGQLQQQQQQDRSRAREWGMPPSPFHVMHTPSEYHRQQRFGGASAAPLMIFSATAESLSNADSGLAHGAAMMSSFNASSSNSVGLAALTESARGCGSASAFRCNSASTRVPRSGRSTLREPHIGTLENLADAAENDGEAVGVPPAFSPSPPAQALEAVHKVDVHGATTSLMDAHPQQQRDSPLRAPFPGFPRSLSATPTSASARLRAAVPGIPPPSPSVDRVSSGSLSATPRHGKRNTLVSPATVPPSYGGVSLRTTSMTPTPREAPVAENPESEGGDAGTLALLARQRRRLLENTKTPAARDQLSAFPMPVISPAQSSSYASGSGARSPAKRAATTSSSSSPSSTFLTAPGGSVRHHVELLLERRRAQQGGGVAPEAEMRASAEGFVAYMTSQLYVAPLPEPQSPALLAKPRETSLSLPTRPRPRQHIGQTL